MRKKTLTAAMAAAIGLAGLSMVPEAVNNQIARDPGIAQQTQTTQRDTNNPGKKAPAQRVQQRMNLQNKTGGLPTEGLFPTGITPPKYYGLWLKQTGRYWRNIRERRSRKYQG